ncbi:hypothetical protein [Methanobrevibacter sp.]|uniref:hypothetical protein n=1 Tax=Methanobrevibacter sp. TaxID=66852 RepID=UPI0025DCBC86|nr:hypothetical protein [Methanobrevibacter sp.]MBR4447681.1 hypothetical protein [Methanobrevibacter sp.]
MKEYDYKKEYKKLLDDYHKLKSKSNVKSDEKTRKSAYELLVAQNKAKYDLVCKWEKENGKLFDGSVEDILNEVEFNFEGLSEDDFVIIPIDNTELFLGNCLYLNKSLIR